MKVVKINFLIERGDAYLDEDRLEIRVPGDWTSYKCSWAVKLDKEISSDRLIEKNNTLAGGSNDELELQLEGNETVFKISLLNEDSSDFQNPKYFHDLIFVDPNNNAKSKTLAKGEFKVEFDVQTPFDGFATPANAVRFLQVDASSAEIGDLLQVSLSSEGEKVVGIVTLAELKRQLENL